jgi:hypothetical protein
MPLVWACAVGLVLTASIVAVRAALHSDPPPPDWRQTSHVHHLHELYRELSGLIHELSLAPEGSADELEQWQSWVEHNLRPRVTEFHRRVLVQRSQGQAYQALLYATDRLGAAAANPGDQRLLAAANTARESAHSLLREHSAYTKSP